MDDIHLDFWIEDGVFVRKKQSANFFTFHSGKRDCPGQALAMKELVIVLAMVTADVLSAASQLARLVMVTADVLSAASHAGEAGDGDC